MQSFWHIELFKGALCLVQYVKYSSGKQVKRVYSDPNNLTSYEIVG
jgi:hypothetical protein